MDWEAFQYAFNELSLMKYPAMSQRDAYNALLHSISNKGPIARGTIPNAVGIYDKLTNTSLYTGTHKQRFDESGHGRGLEGRDTPSKTNALSTMVARTGGHNIMAGTSNTFNQPAITESVERMNKVLGSKTGINNSGMGSYSNLNRLTMGSNSSISRPNMGSYTNINRNFGSNQNMSRSNIGSNSNISKNTYGSNSNFNKGSYGALNKSNSNIKPTSSSNTKLNNGSVFDRLTNSQGYTGTHKNRFDASGKGKGIIGRDYIPIGGGNGDYSGGDVKNLAQILRR